MDVFIYRLVLFLDASKAVTSKLLSLLLACNILERIVHLIVKILSFQEITMLVLLWCQMLKRECFFIV